LTLHLAPDVPFSACTTYSALHYAVPSSDQAYTPGFSTSWPAVSEDPMISLVNSARSPERVCVGSRLEHSSAESLCASPARRKRQRVRSVAGDRRQRAASQCSRRLPASGRPAAPSGSSLQRHRHESGGYPLSSRRPGLRMWPTGDPFASTEPIRCFARSRSASHASTCHRARQSGAAAF
jgi:hypothetical protein